jgi:hypothetical protein
VKINRDIARKDFQRVSCKTSPKTPSAHQCVTGVLQNARGDPPPKSRNADAIYPDDWPPELPKRAHDAPERQPAETKNGDNLDEQPAHQATNVPAERVDVCGSGPELNKPEWIEEVKAAWRKSIEGIVETGRLLLLGHASMPPVEFDALVPREFGFSASMARKLMVIAKDERIANCAIWHKLPRAWTTVYDLTKLDDETFDGMLREGSINPSMTKLVADSAVWLEKHRKGARLKKLPKKFAKAPLKKAKAAASRPQPFDASTAKDLHEFVAKLVAFMRATPPNIAASTRFLLLEERRELAVLASEAITWLSGVYEAASPSARDER